jgi:uncharacterized protein YndB with AHSA1/START domain
MNGLIDPGPPFILEHRLRAPRERVYAAWTNVEELKRWFGPRGVNIDTATLDLRPGGLFHYAMRLPDGSLMWGKWRFEEIEAPRRIVSIVAFSDAEATDQRAPWDAEWPLHTISTMTLHDEGNETRMHLHWRSHNASEGERRRFGAGHDSMRQGWGGTIERLDEYLASEGGRA